MNIQIIMSKEEILNNIPHHTSDEIGALVSFLGIVKKYNNDKEVENVNYSIFENLFYSILEKYCIKLVKRYKNIEVYINQYAGILTPGKINIIISVQSKNRKTAFILCHKLIEFVKNNVPIWKKETYIDGTSRWINA